MFTYAYLLGFAVSVVFGVLLEDRVKFRFAWAVPLYLAIVCAAVFAGSFLLSQVLYGLALGLFLFISMELLFRISAWLDRRRNRKAS